MKTFLTRLKKPLLLTLLCATAITCLAIVRSSVSASSAAAAPSTINVYGRVFQDYNSNGVYDFTATASAPAIDSGLASVTVTAYDPNNVVCGTANTQPGTPAVRGTYNMTVTGTGPYRIEFTNLPPGYFPSASSVDSDSLTTSGIFLNNAGTAVQFIPEQSIEGINLGVNQPGDYCQNNPQICVNEYVSGDSAHSAAPLTTLWRIPYSAFGPSTAANQTAVAKKSDIGSTWGLAYNRKHKKIYSAAFLKRHVGLKNGSLGSIYVSDANGTSTSLFIDLAAGPYNVPVGTVNNAARLLGAPNTYTADAEAFAKIGMVGFGDIDISEDGSTLYAVNLFDRRLYSIGLNPATGLATGTVTSLPIPVPNPACNLGEWRPFALGVKQGSVYVGGVCDASATNATPADLRAVLVKVIGSGAPSQIMDFKLNYTKGKPWAACPTQGNWNPWTNAMPAACIGTLVVYPQPMFTDIEFDNNGSLILAFADRMGHQMGPQSPVPTGTSTTIYTNMIGGDVLRAYKSGASFVLENGGAAENPATALQANNQGPGGGEFYYGDSLPGSHDENSEGGLAMLPGAANVTLTFMDPQSTSVSGVVWLSNSTGAKTRGYDVDGTWSQGFFGKSNGIGDVELLCDLAPIEIGNRVWDDTDGDGIQDSNEPPIKNVTVRLYKGGAPVTGGTAVTDSNGEYYFSSAAGTSTTSRLYNVPVMPNTAYEIRLDNAADYSGGSLNGLSLTTVNAGANDSIDSDAAYVNNPAGSPSSGNFPVIALTTGGAGANDHTFDIGFTKRKENCCGTGTNYVVNGNFDKGDQEFKSAFIFSEMLTPGDYLVGNSETAAKNCDNWSILGHTNCKEDDMFMIVNGMTNQTTGNSIAWGQNVQVEKSEKDQVYHFCAWFKDLKQCCFNQEPKITLQASLNGAAVSSQTAVISAPPDKCGWQLVSTDVTVPAGVTNVNLKILLDQNADGDGNDVAIDDISFAKSDPVPVGTADFNIATQVLNGTTNYNITATPVNTQKPDCKYTWSAAVVTPGGGLVNVATWTSSSSGAFDFNGYQGVSLATGVFTANITYRITYRVACDCMIARSESFDIRRNPSALGAPMKGGRKSAARSDFIITKVDPAGQKPE